MIHDTIPGRAVDQVKAMRVTTVALPRITVMLASLAQVAQRFVDEASDQTIDVEAFAAAEEDVTAAITGVYLFLQKQLEGK